MGQSKQFIYSVVIVTIIGLLVWLFYHNIEFYQETEKSAWSNAAIRDPYLAAQQFLEASNVSVIEAESLLQLKTLEGVGTALLTDANQIANPRQLESVLHWLKQGGNLIVATNALDNSDSLLLSQFHIDVQQPETQDDKTIDNAPATSEALREYNDKIKVVKNRCVAFNTTRKTFSSLQGWVYDGPAHFHEQLQAPNFRSGR